jgi:hypothetical protein
MLTVACVYKGGVWTPSKLPGGYGPRHVERLRKLAARYLTVPHRFVCLTDDVAGVAEAVAGNHKHPVELIPLIHGWPGWWSKLELFRPGLLTKGRVLYIDLDTDIVGNIDHMVGNKKFTVLLNLSSRKRGRIGSGLMFWNGDYSYLYKVFREEPDKCMGVYSKTSDRWGDQGLLQEHLDSWLCWQDLFPNQVRSFKLDKPHASDRIICIHGSGKKINF